MRDQGRRDRAGVGDAEGPVVPERPDVVRRGAEVGPEAVATAEVLVGGVDRLGPGVELGDAASGPGVARWAIRQMAPGLPVQVLASHAEVPGDRRIGPAPRLAPDARIVSRPPRDRLDCRNSDIRQSRVRDDSVSANSPLPQVGQPRVPAATRPEFLEGVGFAHELAECLAALAVVFQDRAPAGRCDRRGRTSQGTSASPRASAQASRRCPERTSQVPAPGPGATTRGTRIPCSRMLASRSSISAAGSP